MSSPFVLRAERGKATRLFLAGPMDGGIPSSNQAEFYAAAAALRSRGYEVVNRAAGERPTGWAWQDYLRRSIPQMLGCDGVAVLPGWETSRETLAETYVAAVLGMPIAPAENWLVQDWRSGELLEAAMAEPRVLARMQVDLKR